LALPYYRPLFTVYLTLGYQLFGLWTPGWHLMNLLVHAGRRFWSIICCGV